MYKGGCLCGAVRFEITGPVSGLDACHCRMCRRISGHYWASADLAESDLRLTGADNVGWYASSEKVKRGFCKSCGAALFWKPVFKGSIAVALGAFDDTGDIRLAKHIFTASKGAYYDISDGLPEHP